MSATVYTRKVPEACENLQENGFFEIEFKMDRRTKAGEPNLDTEDGKIPAAHAIALLSGVNFGSVVKVIAALEAAAEYAGMDTSLLCRLSDVPLDRVNVGDPAHAELAESTKAFCEDAAAYHVMNKTLHAETLNLRDRFLATK